MTRGKCLLLHIPKLHILENGAASSINFIAMGIYSLCHQLVINGFDAEVVHLSVEKYLDKNSNVKAFFATLNETSSGALTDIRAIGNLLKKYPNILFIVDCVSVEASSKLGGSVATTG